MRNLSGLRRTVLLLFALALVASTAADRGVQRATAAPAGFSFNWNGTPAGPTPWSPGAINDWDLIVHNRDHQDSMYMVNAMHGSNCAAYPATHPVSQFQDSVFLCNNHLMTALNGGGYSEIVMTPSRLLDFSASGTVQVSISTGKLNNRDWLDFWISPFSENLLLPSGGIPPDLQGPTKDALLVQINSSIPTDGHIQEFHNYASTDYNGTGMSVETCVAPLGGVSTARRDPFLLTLSRTHVKVDMLINGAPCTLVDTNIADLGFTLGVVQLGHHSYAPDEGTMCNIPGCTVNLGAGAGNTWHWSNFSMSPAVPFTMLRGDMPLTGVQANTSPTVHFAGAAPANSYLRFSGLARRGSIQISANGGSFFPAQEQMQKGDGADGVSDGSFINYWTPIPAGTTDVTFQARDSTQPWAIQDVAIWSSDQASITPISVPPPSGGGSGGGSSGGSNDGGSVAGGEPGIQSGGGSGSAGEPGMQSDGGTGSIGESAGRSGVGSGNPLENQSSASGGSDEHAQTGGSGSIEQPTKQPGSSQSSSRGVRSSAIGPGAAAVAVRDEMAAMLHRDGLQSLVPWVGLLVSFFVALAVLAVLTPRTVALARRAARRRSKK